MKRLLPLALALIAILTISAPSFAGPFGIFGGHRTRLFERQTTCGPNGCTTTTTRASVPNYMVPPPAQTIVYSTVAPAVVACEQVPTAAPGPAPCNCEGCPGSQKMALKFGPPGGGGWPNHGPPGPDPWHHRPPGPNWPPQPQPAPAPAPTPAPTTAAPTLPVGAVGACNMTCAACNAVITAAGVK